VEGGDAGGDAGGDEGREDDGSKGGGPKGWATERQGFDLIYMSDVVYFSDAHADLVDTLTRLVLSPHTTVICAHEFRHPVNERPFFDELLPAAGFDVQQVGLVSVRNLKTAV
jgi:hypothetical protein